MLDSNISSELSVAASKYVKEGEYWVKKLSGHLVKTGFPYDFSRATSLSEINMQSWGFEITGELYTRLMQVSQGYDHTLHMLLVTSLVLLLNKYTGNRDIIVGVPIYKQEMDVEFVNSILALRSFVDDQMTFKELLFQVRQTIVEANENQNYPIETLLYRLDIPFSGTDFPLFDVMVLLDSVHDKKYIKHINPNMIFSFSRTGEALQGEVEFNSFLYDQSSIQRIASHLIVLLQGALFNVNLPSSAIRILSPEEQARQLTDFNRTYADYPVDQTIHGLIEQQVSRTPANIAVMCEGEGNSSALTYSQLEQQANRLAGYLSGGKRIQPGSQVGILMENSLELVIAILGILKAGAAYVPMDPVLPEDRIKRIINDAGLRMVISRKKHIRTLNRLQWECGSFETFLCMDSRDIYGEQEVETNELMDEKLWDYVAETAVDEVTGGGWNSSFTGDPFSQQEMDEYGDNVLAKLEPVLRRDMRVLEIGCASGISMYRIAPRVQYYHGTDLSGGMIRRNRERVKKENHNNIVLTCLPAHRMDTLEDRDFDLIILNSVIQSFHGHNYLRKVIYKAIDLLKPQGYLYVGDIMDHDLKDRLMADLMEFKRLKQDKTQQTKTDFSTELFVSRGYFRDLAIDLPQISHMEFTRKIHTVENELTRYRYDLLMTIDKTGTSGDGDSGDGDRRGKKQRFQEDMRVLDDYGIGKPVITMTPGNPAYVIYTSGTTGTPRGVMIEHCSLVNYIWWAVKTYISGGDEPVTVPLYSSISFDLTVTSIYLPLLTGGTILIYSSEEHRFPVQEIVKADRVDLLKATPSHLKLMLHENIRANKRLKALIVGGEELERSLAQEVYLGFSRGIDIYNEYGPTEATVGCMIYRYNYEKDRRRSVSIGLPAANVSIYILDRGLNPVPTGGIGEIYIGGAALARGYVNQVAITHEKFINKKFYGGPGGGFSKEPPGRRRHKIYKTGDLARRLADGNIEFLGRVDEQVKIRGYRIELQEIRSQLLTHGDVGEAVVIAREASGAEDSADRVLCAYVVPEKEVEKSELVAYLSVRLPDYMIPSYIMLVDRIPLTPNGKVDKKVLPEPQIQGEEGAYVAPGNKTQVVLVDIWSRVLGIEKSIIGIDTNFFELGGHSLKATILIAEIHKALDVKIPLAEIFKHPFIRELADYIDRTTVEEFSRIEPVEKKDYYVTSSAQKRHYIIQHLKLLGLGYNESIVSILEGQLDRAHVEETFRKLIRRHESLRTSFHIVNDEPVQRIVDPGELEFEIEYYDLSAGRAVGDNPGSVSGARLSARQQAAEIIKNFIRPFELEQAPLMRVGLIKEEEEKHVLLVDMHHIVTDGTSMGILRGEFMVLYKGESPQPLEIQYKDFSQWQNSEPIRASMDQQQAYWLAEFAGELPVLELPMDFPRPAEKSFEGNAMGFALNSEESEAIREIARQEEATVYMVLLAAFNILLNKLSSGEDIVVGTPIAGRRHADLQPVIGMFVNTLAMRNYPRHDRTFADFLKEVKVRTLEAFENQDYQFEELVDRLGVPRDTSRNPIFEAMFAVQNMETPTVEIPRLKLFTYPREEHASPFDIFMSGVDTGKQITFTVEYSTAIFKPETIQRMIGYFKKILSSLAGDPGQPLSALQLLSEEERARVLYEFNDTAGESPEDKTIPQLFQQQVERTPDQVALVGPPTFRAITYRELHRKSNQLGHRLRQAGIGPDRVVGLLVERSFEMIIGILAILKAGAAYLPMDTEYPPERILLMLSDSGAPVLLTREKNLDDFSITLLKNMKAGSRTLIVTPAQEQIKDFDSLPKPDRSLVNYEKYHQTIGVAMGRHTVSIQATRGCPFHCLYCHKLWPKTHVSRSAESILDEIRCIYDAGVKRFVFIDDIFNLDKRNSAAVFSGIIKEGLDLQIFFPNGLRGDILTKEFIDLMAAGGTVSLSLALESACPRIQKLINKNLNLEKFEEIVRYIIDKYPWIILEMGLMLGFPTESEAEALMTLEFLESLKWVHFPNLHILKIYPNTEMFKMALAHGVSEVSIQRSANLAYHEVPDTLPFPKHFVRQYQTRFLDGYFLSKERLKHVLPLQARTLAGGEFIQKYNSYLPMEINDFSDILDSAGFTENEFGPMHFLPDHHMTAPDFNNRIKKHFPRPPEVSDPFRVLLLDLSLLFSTRQDEGTLYDMVDAPLGLMYLLTYINKTFDGRVRGKIAKSRIDFDHFQDLHALITDFKPDIIGIRTLSFFKEFFHQTVLMIREWGIQVPIIAGGPYATSDYSLILQDDYVDLVVLGEGELVFTRLIEKIMENNRQIPGEEVLQQINGLAFVKGKFKTAGKKEDKEGNLTPGHQVLQERRTREIILLDEMGQGMNRYPETNLKPVNHPQDMLYVIYTSGSTGIPKAVMLEHRNLVNLMHYTFTDTAIDCSSVLQFATISFDVSFQEIFSTLLAGGKLVLIDSKTRGDIPELFRAVEKNRIKTLFLPTSFLKFLFSEAEYINLIPPGIRHLVTAGEQLVISDMLRSYLKKNNVYLHNHYGPSETHVVTALTLDPQGDIPQVPSIGTPILNTTIYILDKGNHLQPIGVSGELCIGGIQVGRGYLGKTDLTEEKFITPTFMDRERLYKTGDQARWQARGTIEFLGRIDHQVKIRGFRVEPGEIETQLLKCEEIKEAAVVTRKDKNGDNYLCAYVVPALRSEKKPDIKVLRDTISKSLPDYMIPAYFVLLDNIPLTPNGKVNRAALPEPEARGTGDFVAPASELEKKLAVIWAGVLNIPRYSLGVHDNFFQLGGHSLKATILVSRIHRILGVKVPLVQMFKTPHIRTLAGYIQEAAPNRFVSIEPVEKKEYYCLSSAQKRLYFLQQFDPGSISYNLARQVPWQGEVDIDALENVFRQLIDRHESLRTSFDIVQGQPVQRIHDRVEFKVGYYQTPQPGNDAENKAEDDFQQPFDLSRAPLLRAGLIGGGENHFLVIDMHHIITDGTAQDVLIKEFISLYSRKKEELPGMRLQYKDYAHWQTGKQHQGSIRQQEVYWLQVFSDEVPVLNLTTDFPRPQVQSFAGRVVYFMLNPQDTGKLRKASEENDTTLYMFILTILNILLAKMSGQEDIVIGTPIAARRHADLENIVGMFVNTLPMRNLFQPEKTFKAFLRQVKTRTLEALENQEYQFEDLVEKVSVVRDASRNPIFDVTFGLWSQSEYWGDIPEKDDTAYTHVGSTSKFDLSVTVVEVGQKLLFNIEYSSQLFKADTIERIIGYFKKIAASTAVNQEQQLSTIELLTETEKKQILCDFNDTQAQFPEHMTIHEMFAQQANKSPDRIAVTGMTHGAAGAGAEKVGGKQLVHITYDWLDHAAAQLAGVLIEAGVHADTCAAIMLERSLEMVIGIYAILKAGGAYLPIDPQYPRERIDYMMADSSAGILLTSVSLEEKVKEIKNNAGVMFIDSVASPVFTSSSLLAFPSSQSTNLAYIIYTSGSTGRPKGVMVEHRSAVNILTALQQEYPLGEDDTYLFKTSYLFDVSVTELFGWFFAGGRLTVLEAGKEKDPRGIITAVEFFRVTHINFVPSMFNVFVEGVESEDINRLSGLKYIFLAGEALPPQLVRQAAAMDAQVRLENIYGPTEGTVYSCNYSLSRWQGQGSIPIGTPMQNVQLHILDKYGCIQPVLVPGELCIAGTGLARGYLNNPELTAGKFIAVPRASDSPKSQLIYKTGDLARWRADGDIEFLGRMDFQVKIRGFRIELEEIQEQLVKHEQIKEAVVIAGKHEDNRSYLAAYIVPAAQQGPGPETLNVAELRKYLSLQLPEYMIPTYFVQLEKLPVTPTGKIAGKSLPPPEQNRLKPGETFVPPQTQLEKLVAEAWKNTLKLENIGINDSFFELGGNSIEIVIITNQLRSQLAMDIPVAAMFRYRTIKALVGYLTQQEDQGKLEIDRSEALKRGEEKKRKKMQMRKRNIK